jgi:hypothetical protein
MLVFGCGDGVKLAAGEGGSQGVGHEAVLQYFKSAPCQQSTFDRAEREVEAEVVELGTLHMGGS